MPKELAFHDALRESRTIEFDEGAARPRPVIVHGAGDELLADATFAENQDRGFCSGDPLDQAVHFLHRLGVADEVGRGNFS